MHINTTKLGHVIAKGIPHIFTAAGVLWYGIAACTAFNTGHKVMKELEKPEHERNNQNDIAKEMLPTVGAFAIGTACVILSDACNTRMLRASTAAYNRLSKNFQEYKAAVIGALGVEANHQALKSSVEQNKPDMAEQLEPGQYHFYDAFSRNDFVSTLEQVIAAEYDINRSLTNHGFVTVNEFYDYLGIVHIDRGDDIGWDIGELADYCGIPWLDFENVEHIEEDGGKWYSIHPVFDPTIDGVIDSNVDWVAIKDMIAKSGEKVIPETL